MAPRGRKTGAADAMIGGAWRGDLARGLRSLAAGEFARAEAHFARAFERAPQQPEVCFALGRERLRQGRVEEAERLLRAAWQGDRTLASAAAALARCLGTAAGRFPEAHAVLDEALALHPDETGLLVVRGELYLEEDRVDDAVAALERALVLAERAAERSPAARTAAGAALARAHNARGLLLGVEGRNEEALFAFKRAFDLDPEWAGPLVNMGVAFARLGRGARARSCYERALALEPTNAFARFNLANMAREAGDVRKAEAGYRAVLELDEAFTGARLALAELIIARGDVDEAIAMLTAELDRAPEDADVWYSLGVACDLAERPGPAERHLRGALALDPEHVGAHCRLAQLLARTGRYLEAAALARRASELDAVRAKALLGPLGGDA